MFFFLKERENLSCYYPPPSPPPLPPRRRWAYQSLTICTASGYWIFEAKSLGIFSVRRSFGGNFQAPHKQRFGFCDSPFSFMRRWHLRRHFCDTLHVLRSNWKQTCGHTILKYREKRQVNTRLKGISHVDFFLFLSFHARKEIKKAPDDLCDLGLIGVT